MLQQTQVKTVIPYFNRFLARFPNIKTLAKAPLDDVLHLWAGLGYYSRARNLHHAAIMLYAEYQNQFPDTLAELIKLPGIGRSTAGAILAISMNKKAAILDGNVRRVLTRLHTIRGWSGEKAVNLKLWEIAEHYTPKTRAGDYTQALMDLGATICMPRKPLCPQCPVQKHCQANLQDDVKQYPTPKPKKTLPVRRTRMLLMENSAGEIMLEKRPPVGIWGGLWSLPECEEGVDIKKQCKTKYSCKVHDIRHAPAFRHTFSHFHLDITPIILKIDGQPSQVMDSADRVWYKFGASEGYALPAPIKYLLQQNSEDTP